MSENLKTSRMYVRLSETDKRRITQKAKELKMSRSEYILQCVRKNKIIQLQGIDRIIKQLFKIGTNINQIAGKANSINYISQAEVTETKNYMAEIFKLIEKFINENNQHINLELQNDLTEEQKFELILRKLDKIELILGSVESGILQNIQESD